MKKTISISILALVALTSCKKDYSNFESYSISYQTLNDTLKITIKGSLNVNQLNTKLVKLTVDKAYNDVTGILEDGKTIKYQVSIKGATEATMNFYKIDGSVIKMTFIKSDKTLNTNY